jgi:hypothetical protein
VSPEKLLSLSSLERVIHSHEMISFAQRGSVNSHHGVIAPACGEVASWMIFLQVSEVLGIQDDCRFKAVSGDSWVLLGGSGTGSGRSW